MDAHPKAEAIPIDPTAPWRNRQGGRTDQIAVQGGCKFILDKVSQYGAIPKLLLAAKFAAIPGVGKPTWELVLPRLIQTGQIHLVVDTIARTVLVVAGPERGEEK